MAMERIGSNMFCGAHVKGMNARAHGAQDMFRVTRTQAVSGAGDQET
ncbi:hypothetical protein GQE99_01350 [Maritimibacter sp. DP07]|uniref:Uncharacterized protein n=1 Tax=Maritimibacter harenae TaxID=2606218 RepID=A0A845LY14_9RHOB|nr:hypothetical protein [Maritimibacter harenae]MZR11669.1 hypothetical protein [Maritimibacter harenae]